MLGQEGSGICGQSLSIPSSGKLVCTVLHGSNVIANISPSSIYQSTTSTFGMCTDTFDGTSSATPLVSGVLALVLEAKWVCEMDRVNMCCAHRLYFVRQSIHIPIYILEQ